MKLDVAGNEKVLVAARSREDYFVIANVTSYFSSPFSFMLAFGFLTTLFF